ncbi:hypothetical protein [Paraliobacillus sp. JSM ZJ581]|uniref:hypothetical protein n=1 Tax=Paraliobacillus sp. JSM ZJ581 TaxID=3342118 RepID=UPI0035A9987F
MFTNKSKILTAILMASIISIYFMYLNLTPYIGIQLEKENNYQVESISEIGWGRHNDIQIGDTIRAINGQTAKEHNTVIEDNRIENATSISIERNNIVHTYQVHYSSDLTTQYIYFHCYMLYLMFF